MCFRYRAVKRCIECASHSRNPLTPQQLLFPFRDAFEPRTRLYAYSYNKPANSFPRTSPRRFRLRSTALSASTPCFELEPNARAIAKIIAFNRGDGWGGIREKREGRVELRFFFPLQIQKSWSCKFRDRFAANESGNFSLWERRSKRNRGRGEFGRRVTFGSFLRVGE